jgi:SAM-dependent methyltransferase
VSARADAPRIASYYDALVDRFGHDPRAVDASSRDSLLRRYRVLAEATDLTGKSVLEVGCGLGDLGAYLIEQFPGLDYRGVDLSPRMIAEGRRSHPLLDLRVANVLDLGPGDGADVVLAQGIFYLLCDDAEAKAFELIAAMLGLARETCAFTALSAWAPVQDADEFYLDPVRLVAHCRRLPARLVLRHDYHPGDVAAYLYRTGDSA